MKTFEEFCRSNILHVILENHNEGGSRDVERLVQAAYEDYTNNPHLRHINSYYLRKIRFFPPKLTHQEQTLVDKHQLEPCFVDLDWDNMCLATERYLLLKLQRTDTRDASVVASSRLFRVNFESMTLKYAARKLKADREERERVERLQWEQRIVELRRAEEQEQRERERSRPVDVEYERACLQLKAKRIHPKPGPKWVKKRQAEKVNYQEYLRHFQCLRRPPLDNELWCEFVRMQLMEKGIRPKIGPKSAIKRQFAEIKRQERLKHLPRRERPGPASKKAKYRMTTETEEKDKGNFTAELFLVFLQLLIQVFVSENVETTPQIIAEKTSPHPNNKGVTSANPPLKTRVKPPYEPPRGSPSEFCYL